MLFLCYVFFFCVLSFIHGQHDYVAQFTWVVDIFYLNLMIIKQKHKKNSKVENMIQQLCVFVPHPLAVLRTLISKSANVLFIFVDRENSQTKALVKRTRK